MICAKRTQFAISRPTRWTWYPPYTGRTPDAPAPGLPLDWLGATRIKKPASLLAGGRTWRTGCPPAVVCGLFDAPVRGFEALNSVLPDWTIRPPARSTLLQVFLPIERVDHDPVGDYSNSFNLTRRGVA